MGEISEEPESKSAKQAAQKTRAEDNPWYLLATLYGVPGEGDYELQKKNRVTWNRYFAANLDDKMRARLIEEKRHPAEELTPFSPEQLEDVKRTFAKRCKASGKILALPASDADIDFCYVDFEQGAFFGGYLVRDCFFQSATFSGAAVFARTTFSKGAHFDGAAFSSWASFGGAVASGGASFDGATFSGKASFGGAAFSGGASFDDAAFGQESSFVNAEMKGETSFERATFENEPPTFFNAKLHQGTVWRDIKDWPKPKLKDEAGRFLDAYACLKLEMDRLKKHEDELDFFALELQSRRVLQESELKGSGLPIALYGLVADYGRSYARPLYAIIAVAAFGTLVLLLSGALAAPWQSLGMSVANTLNVFGFRKDLLDPHLFENLPAPLKILAAGQTILGAILLFLFGLGVRNKFRMK
ncbi:MAG: pentapeptide repeat-containing protein [Methylocella sp.]